MPSKKIVGNILATKGNMREIVGVRGQQLVQAYLREELRQDNLKIEDYRRMLDNDGQMQMIWNAIVNTILQAGIDIIDDKSVKGEESEQLQFVKKNLLSRYSAGGMSMSMNLVNRTLMRAFIEGYIIHEIVWRTESDGKFALDKVLPRTGSNDRELKIRVDEDGNFIGIRQRLSYQGLNYDLVIDNTTQYKKLVKTTFGEEFGSLYGRSGVRAAWYHYDKAHKGMYLNHVGHELGVIRPRDIAISPQVTEEQRQALLNAYDRLHVESTITRPKDIVEVNMLEATDPNVMREGKDMINFHYSAMSKSVLAQFVDLGSGLSDTGSRSLGETHGDFFKQGLQAMAQIIIEDTWNEIISDLVRANFGDTIMPRLIVKPISDKRTKALYDVMLEIVKNGLPDSVTKEIITKNAESLGLDVSEEEIQGDMDEKRKAAEEARVQVPKSLMVNNSEVSLVDPLQPATIESDGMARPLYPDELKVNIPDIKRQLDMAREMSERVLALKLSNDKDRIINQFVEAIRSGRKAIGKVNVELAEGERGYRQELVEIARETFDFGKRSASDEVGRETAGGSARLAGVDDRVNAAVDEQESRLGLRLSVVANDSLDNGIPENEAKILMEQEYESFWDKTLLPTVALMISKMFNMGRGIAFKHYGGSIFAYRYTAVLDSRTTEYCRELDGKVFQANDPNFALLTPPQHFGCRSFWTPILFNESEGIEVNGKPSDLPIYSSVSTFKDV